MAYAFDFSIIWQYREALMNGLVLTLQLSGVSIIFGTVGAIILGFMRASSNKLAAGASTLFIETIRGLPFVVLLIWIYFALPILIAVQIPAFEAAVIALTFTLAGFGAEIVRAGIESIPKGQIHAAQTLGLSQHAIYSRIILPQVARKELSPMIGWYLTTLKFSSLASIIALPELVHQSNNIILTTYRPLEVYTAVALIYLMLSIPFTYFSQRFEYKRFMNPGAVA